MLDPLVVFVCVVFVCAYIGVVYYMWSYENAEKPCEKGPC